jgi:hypothetical protein
MPMRDATKQQDSEKCTLPTIRASSSRLDKSLASSSPGAVSIIGPAAAPALAELYLSSKSNSHRYLDTANHTAYQMRAKDMAPECFSGSANLAPFVSTETLTMVSASMRTAAR